MLRRMLPGKGRLWPRAAHGGPLSSQRRATLAGSAASEFSAATAAFRDRRGRDQWLRPRHAGSPVDLRGCLWGRDRPDAPLEHGDRQGHSPCGQVRRRLAACGDAGAETALQPPRPAGQPGIVDIRRRGRKVRRCPDGPRPPRHDERRRLTGGAVHRLVASRRPLGGDSARQRRGRAKVCRDSRRHPRRSWSYGGSRFPRRPCCRRRRCRPPGMLPRRRRSKGSPRADRGPHQPDRGGAETGRLRPADRSRVSALPHRDPARLGGPIRR